MQRINSCLRLVAGLAVFTAVPFVSSPAQGAGPNPSAWRFRSPAPANMPQMLTVSRTGGHDWFIATNARGKELRVSLPPKFGWVQREGKLVPAASLRPGDRVDVWGLPGSRQFQAARVRVLNETSTATRLVSARCCAACATCTKCDTGCASCKSQSECQTCCGASCCPSDACCA